ncbi:MAG: ABC-F family ATP-binding cassette domain-containing protein [Pseudomonadota bacterium]
MTNSVSLTLQGVSYQLPDGRLLFSQLNEQFDDQPTGLVGRNGIGKSVLARILAGELTPTSGRCQRIGTVHYLAQQISPQPDQTVADLVGVSAIIDALDNIESGSTRQQDFDAVGDRWNIRTELQRELAINRLDYLQEHTPATQLSGGEAMRVALIGAFLSGAEMLILDEPTNHLDRDNRRALLDQLQRWTGGLIVVSHDRALLDTMKRTVELSSFGLRSYGGGYSFYAETKAHEREAALQQLELRKTERKREEALLTQQRERLDKQQARGSKKASEANQAPILLGLQKSRSQVSGGKLRARQKATREALSLQVMEASRKVERDAEIVLLNTESDLSLPDKVVELLDVTLPHIHGPHQKIDLLINKAQRIGLIGPNGSGKSTLLKVLAGRLAPVSGQREVFVETAYLDQHLSVLDPETSILDQMLVANTGIEEGKLRSRLALLGLDVDRIRLPTCMLSGGERLKAAIAKVLYADKPAQLLLLDEPCNHMDLASVEALESMLRQYQGPLIVVSHDESFLDNIELTQRLQPSQSGWSMTEY